MPESLRSSRSRNALAGATLLITRPAGTGAAFARRVRAQAGTAVSLPGLALRAPTDPQHVLVALRGARVADAWLFTSPAAVRFAYAVAPALRIAQRARVFAIGAGTRAALARHGVAAIAPERSDSEGLLALPGLGRVRGQRIVLVGAPGGRDLIAPALRARGAVVEAIHVYRREPPRLTRRHFDALAAADDPLITLLSSGEALANLVAALPPPLLARLRAQTIVVSSARLAGAARAAGFGSIVTATSAAPRDLLAAAAHALARHRL